MIQFRINNHLVAVENAKHAISLCFSSADDLKYWSYEALRKLYIGTINIFFDYYDEEYKSKKGSEKAAITRFKNYCKNRKKYISRDRMKLLYAIYEMILSSEGKGILNKFGIYDRKFDGSIGGINAEVNRISKVRSD